MRTLLLLVLGALLTATGAFAMGSRSSSHSHKVSRSSSRVGRKSSTKRARGTKKGTNAKAYQRTRAKRTKRKRYSTKGNIHAYIGKAGIKTAKK
jgi:hypothetical protein